MYQRVLAFNFDGTLAENGSVPPALQVALRQLHAAGHILFMVTGQRFESIDLGSLDGIFAGIVWENGAVLYHAATNDVYLPFGQVNSRLVDALKTAGVPLEHGRAIVSTRVPYDEAVWRVIGERSGGVAIAYNKGAVMISPPGTATGAGLERLLELCGLSPRNLVSFGDSENNLSLLELGEIGVAVSDAVPVLKEVADLVTTRPGPAGVLEALEAYWLSGAANAALRSVRRERPILLGEDEGGVAVSLPGPALASGNLGVFGDSGTGKSWVTGLLAEGMHRAGYQVLLIDPEGDYRGMRTLPKIMALDGNLMTLPSPIMVVALLEKMSVSVVLDLCSYPVDHRERYVVELLRELRSMKARMFRPHWVVLEEAQYFLPPDGNSVSDALLPMLPDGGWAFVSYHPDRLAAPVLASLDYCLLTRLSESGAVRHLHRWFSMDGQWPADIPAEHAWLYGRGLVHLRPATRRVPHVRHLHKYLDTPLPPNKRFYFRDEHGSLGVEAASLFEFRHCLSDLSLESLTYHHARGDFAAWAADALGDGILAAQLRKLARRSLEGESLRTALVKCVASHYAELHVLP